MSDPEGDTRTGWRRRGKASVRGGEWLRPGAGPAT